MFVACPWSPYVHGCRTRPCVVTGGRQNWTPEIEGYDARVFEQPRVVLHMDRRRRRRRIRASIFTIVREGGGPVMPPGNAVYNAALGVEALRCCATCAQHRAHHEVTNTQTGTCQDVRV
jgi:hypothetical protein